MNITSTHNLAQPSRTSPALATQTASLHKPQKDQWLTPSREAFVTEERFDIDEMIQYARESDETSLSVAYQYKRELTLQDRFQRAGEGALRGAFIGGVVLPFVGLMGITLADAVGNSAFGTISGLSFTPNSTPLLQVGMAIGGLAVGTAAFGGVLGFAEPSYHRVTGQLTKGEEGLRFTSKDQKRSVLLEDYRDAIVPDKIDGTRNYGNQWWNKASES